MLDLYDNSVYPSEVAGNYNACGAYGGCAFREECDKLKGENMAGLDDLIKGKIKTKKPAEEAPKVIPDAVAEEAPKIVEHKTKTRPSKSNQQKAAIAALETLTATYKQLEEMMKKLNESQQKVLDKLNEDL